MTQEIDLVQQLMSEGYRAGSPSAETERFDREVLSDCHCTACGNPTLLYKPFIKWLKDRLSYRPLAVCPACGEAQEF